MYDIEIFHTQTHKEPYTQWFLSLDIVTAARIDARLSRIRQTGNFGLYKSLGEGVFELKFDFGPGYRVYFAHKTKVCILLLLGGIKNNQQKDIDKAKKYWSDHLSIKGDKNEKI